MPNDQYRNRNDPELTLKKDVSGIPVYKGNGGIIAMPKGIYSKNLGGRFKKNFTTSHGWAKKQDYHFIITISSQEVLNLSLDI